MSTSHSAQPAASPSATEQADDGYLFYLYCVLEKDTPARHLLQRKATPGLEEGEPLFLIEADSLMAAVSRVPARVFQEGPLNALLQDLPRLAPYAVRHEQAIKTLLPEAPALIPLSMGAVYRSSESVVEMLRQNASKFRLLLRRVSGKREWTLRVVRERTPLLDAVRRSSAALRDLETQASQETPGRAYLLRKQQERTLEGEVDKFLRHCLDSITADVRNVSAALRVDALPGLAPVEVMLVFKAAVLVDVQGQRAFQAAVKDLAETYGSQGVRVEVTGPWAPYSFVAESYDAG